MAPSGSPRVRGDDSAARELTGRDWGPDCSGAHGQRTHPRSTKSPSCRSAQVCSGPARDGQMRAGRGSRGKPMKSCSYIKEDVIRELEWVRRSRIPRVSV
jgi:hypothetical protein